METEVQTPDLKEIPEPTPAPVEGPAEVPEGIAPEKETDDIAAKLTAAEAEVVALRATVQAKDRAVAAVTKEYQGLTARIAQVDSAKERAELDRRLELARDDPDEAVRVITDIRAKLQRSDTEDEVQKRVWGEAYQSVVGRAYQNPIFADLALEEKQQMERIVLQSGGGADDVLAVWAGALREKEKMAATEAATGLAELKAEVEALKNQRAGAAIENEGGPENPAPAGGGGKSGYRTLEDLEAAHVRGDVTSAEVRRLRPTLKYSHQM